VHRGVLSRHFMKDLSLRASTIGFVPVIFKKLSSDWRFGFSRLSWSWLRLSFWKFAVVTVRL
jgi:hypothetical protein